jgi:uncharacterized protein (TIGR02271 family)
MAKTVVGLFDDLRTAQDAGERLVKAGFDRSDVSIVRGQEQTTTGGTSAHGRTDGDAGDVTSGEGAAIGAGTGAAIGAAAGGAIWALAAISIPGLGPALGVGPLAANLIGGAGIGAVTGGLTGALINSGVPEEDAKLYDQGVRRGGTLLTVRADDARADQAADILSDAGAVDIDERAAGWDQSTDTQAVAGTDPRRTAAASDVGTGAGMNAMAADTDVASTRDVTTGTGMTAAAASYDRSDMSKSSPEAGRRDIRPGEAIPVVEEELAVGKRQVRKGGVRVYSHVVEKPVEEQVTLHEESVNVQRRPVNRPVTDADQAFREGTIEVTETDEEAVASKRAVVKEEIVVNKEAHDRTETVRDTLRATDVKVEQIPGSGAVGDAHVTGSARAVSDVDLESDLRDFASDNRYAGADWTNVESDYRRRYESRHPGSTWDKVKDSARSAWERTKSTARDRT